MRTPRLNRWPTPEADAGLLLFAQRIEESLFDYTLDSYKAPALNTHTRALELRNAISDVQKAGFPESALSAIVEELAYSIQHDIAARPLLEPYTAHFEAPENWRSRSVADLAIEVELILSRLRGRYRKELVSQLRTFIAGGKEKGNLLQLTTNWVVELVNEGFSRDYIFFRTRGYFFGLDGAPIQGMSSFDEFVAFFDAQDREWEVVFRASKSFNALGTRAENETVALPLRLAEHPPEVVSRRGSVRAFLKPDPERLFLIVRQKAFDARSARERADRTVQTIATFMRLHVHRTPFEWSGDSVVLGEGRSVYLKRSPSPVLKHSECKISDLPKRLVRTVEAFTNSGLPSESVQRLVSALNLHSAALTSPEVENQLVSLWASLEALLPMATADAKIARIAEFMVPLLSRSYPAKLLDDLESSLLECTPDAYAKVQDTLPSEWTTLERLGAIIGIDENEALRDQLYAAADHNVLLRSRIWQLKRQLSDAASIRVAIELHARRVNWHLRRIYRSRNLLVHSGRTLPYREVIVESLHSYVDRVVSLVEETMLRKPRPRNLDSALMAIRMDHEAHLRMLVTAKKTACAEANFRDLLFGPAAALGA